MGAESAGLDRDALIEKNLPLVGYQVAELLRRVPSFVQREDLASAGSLALVQAANSYNPETGVPFHRFAIYRIRGAMLDELRAMDWATRGARSRTKQLEEMTAELTAAQGRAPTREELARALGVEVEQIESAQLDATRRVVSIDVTFGEDDARAVEIIDEGLTPEDSLLTDERLVYLQAAVKALPKRLRYVVEQVFFENRQISEVADSLGVTQSRVSQLRTEALAMMRDGMEHHLDSVPPPAETKSVKKVSIIEKRRQSYLRKLADNAHSLLGVERSAATAQSVPPAFGRPDKQPVSASFTPPEENKENKGNRENRINKGENKVNKEKGQTSQENKSASPAKPANGESANNKSANSEPTASELATSELTISEPRDSFLSTEPPPPASRRNPQSNAPTVRAELNPLRPTTSASGFLVGRSKGSAQAKAQLRAEALAAAEEEKKRKSKDKVRNPRRQIPEESPEEPAVKSTPPTASYLGELSLRRHSSPGR